MKFPQLAGPGTWNLLEKSLFMKSKTCIIGSKFFSIVSVLHHQSKQSGGIDS
jgi:hypothetical protein